jgi:hypothetical protein
MGEASINHEVGTPLDFELYQQLMATLNTATPQRQGLSVESEFRDACLDPRTVLTSVITEGGQAVEVPQIADIDHFSWLNVEHYRKLFPDEASQGNLRCLLDTPNAILDPSSLDELRRLASENGVVVFDTTSARAGQEAVIFDMLKSHGLVPEDAKLGKAQLIGTQTYFAGKIGFNEAGRKHGRRPNPLTIAEAYEEAVEHGVARPLSYDSAGRPIEGFDKVVLSRAVNPEVADYMNTFYAEAYESISEHPCRQGLDPDEFTEMAVRDHDIEKIMCLSGDAIPESLYLLCNDLSKLTWVNTEYYRKYYPKDYENGQLLWFPGIATNPETAGHNSEAIIQLIAELTDRGDNPSTVVFDCCDMNSAWLPAVLNGLINNTPQSTIDIQPIAKQEYWAVRLGTQT